MQPRSPSFDVRLSDVIAFLGVHATGSVTAAARSLGTTPSHLSKSIDRLERQLGSRLLTRSGRGIALTPAASRMLPLLSTAANALKRARKHSEGPRDVTVAAPSYLISAFVPALAEAVNHLRLRALQLAPPSIRAALGTGQFEVALNTGDARMPPGWIAEPVGELQVGLFANPLLARKLGRPTLDALREVPFIVPVSFKNGEWEPVDDGCPLPVGDRIAGHEAPAIGLALEIAAHAPQLVFGPCIAARRHVTQRRLVEIQMPGWQVRHPLYLAVDVDRVTSHELALLKRVALEMLETPQGPRRATR